MIVSHSSFDLGTDTSVPVIASFTSDGHIAPLYVRIRGIPLKVDSYWVRTQFLNTVEFNCKVIDDGMIKPIILIYHRNENIWTVSNHCFEE